MKVAGVKGCHPLSWKRTTVRCERPVDASDRLGRSFFSDNPNEKWCGDITYIRTWDGWSFFATYKEGLIRTRPWPNIKTLKKETFTWIEEYDNRTRPHSTLDYLTTLEYVTPVEYEIGYQHINELVA